ncbi:hypothetical protein ACF0H5_004867 [Mactra antiquata]
MKVLILLCTFIFGLCQGQNYDGCGCPDGWIRFRGSCYFFSYKHGMYFNDAQQTCIGMRGSLVHINNVAENTFLKDYLHRMKDNNYWIGLNDQTTEGVWTYVDTNEIVEYTDWAPGQPDSWHAHNEDCALFYSPHNYHWDDGPCNQDLDYICEMKLPETAPVDVIG